MAIHTDPKSRTKPRVLTDKRKVITPPLQDLEVPCLLIDAIEEHRSPSTEELLEECRSMLGVALISLRGSRDAHKAAQSIAQVVRAVTQIAGVEQILSRSPSDLKAMSNDEFLKYIQEVKDKIK